MRPSPPINSNSGSDEDATNPEHGAPPKKHAQSDASSEHSPQGADNSERPDQDATNREHGAPLKPRAESDASSAHSPQSADNSERPDQDATNRDPDYRPQQSSSVDSKGDNQSNSAARFEPARIGGRFTLGEIFGGKYEILGHVGQGGMGVVYKARDPILDRLVAIKFLKAKSGISALEMSRFQQEAKAIASLDHRNIIRVHDMSVTADGDPFFVLEYLEGSSLSHELRAQKKLPLPRALELILQICDALQHAHSKGIVHRDIKPSNIMLVKDATGVETVKLLDFGIAKLHSADDETILKLTKTGELFGSPHYMSPEQCSGQKVDKTTDIYSAGCVFFEMLTGGPPFSGATPFETLDLHKNAPPPSVSVKCPDLENAKEIDASIGKMLSKNPVDRYKSAQDVREALLQLEKKSIKLAEKPKKNKVLIAVGLLLFIGVVSVSLFVYQHNSPPLVQSEPDKTPWATYDLKGQQLFDKGAYGPAEKYFLKALNKAKLEKSKSRLLHINTSLRELQMIYHTTENQKGINWTTEELLNSTPAPLRTPYSWKELLEVADLLKQKSTMSAESEFIDDVAAVAFSNKDPELSTKKALSVLIQKLSGNEMVSSQIRVIEAVFFLEQREFPPKESKLALKFILSRPEGLSVRLKALAVRLAFSQQSLDVNSCERILRSVKIDPTSVDSILAQVSLAKLDWSLDKKGLAVSEIEESLFYAERLMPRNYTLIADALFTLATYSRADSASKVLPLFVRAKAIAECEHFNTNANIQSARELIVLGLVDVLTELGRLSEAEAALKSLLTCYSNTESKDSFGRPNVLAQLGYIYLQRKMYSEAEECLLEAITAFEVKADSLPLSCQEPYASSLHNLSQGYKYMGKQGLSEQYAARAKSARLMFRRNLPTARH